METEKYRIRKVDPSGILLPPGDDVYTKFLTRRSCWILMSLGGALVHVPILVLLSPLVWAAALVAFGLVFRFLPPAPEGRLGHLVSLATFGLGAVAILAASAFTGSVVGDATCLPPWYTI